MDTSIFEEANFQNRKSQGSVGNPAEGEEDSPNEPEDTGGDDGEPTEPYRKFDTKEEFGKHGDDIFKKGYSEASTKVVKQLNKEFGIEADELDDAIGALKGRFDSDESTDGEVKELRDKFKESQSTIESLKNELSQTKMQNSITSAKNQAVSELTESGDLTIDKDSIYTLFENEYSVEEMDGELVAVKDGRPDIDGSTGDRRTLSESIAEFARKKNFVKSNKEGAGGGTGDTPSVEKPKKSEWRKLLRSSGAKAETKAGEMYARAKQVGWADE